jgi:hypothetical protein
MEADNKMYVRLSVCMYTQQTVEELGRGLALRLANVRRTYEGS